MCNPTWNERDENLLPRARYDLIVFRGSRVHWLLSAAAEALGEASLLKAGIKVGVQMYMDATAGISLGSRRGLRRAKHIDTILLWVQEYVTKGKINIGKKHTSEMLADFLTKSVPENITLNALSEMGYKYEEGQHGLALRV